MLFTAHRRPSSKQRQQCTTPKPPLPKGSVPGLGQVPKPAEKLNTQKDMGERQKVPPKMHTFEPLVEKNSKLALAYHLVAAWNVASSALPSALHTFSTDWKPEGAGCTSVIVFQDCQFLMNANGLTLKG